MEGLSQEFHILLIESNAGDVSVGRKVIDEITLVLE